MQKINIFLDLEETVIDEWSSCNFLINNISFIKNMINTFSMDLNNQEADNENINLILFSAAVSSEKDLLFFREHIQDFLEEQLELVFSDFFIFDIDTLKSLAKSNQINVLPDDSIQDIFNFNEKEQIFQLIAIENEINILFDDIVENKIIQKYNDNLFEKPSTLLIQVNTKEV